MTADVDWRAWVHAALIHDLSAYFVGHTEAVARARKIATDIGNQGFVWTLDYYTPLVPAPAARALDVARNKLFTQTQMTTLAEHTCDARPTIDKQTKRILYRGEATKRASSPLLSNVDAPAALAAWDLLHPGATKTEIQKHLLVGSVEDGGRIFADDNTWVADRIKRLQRAARGLTVRKHPHRGEHQVCKPTST